MRSAAALALVGVLVLGGWALWAATRDDGDGAVTAGPVTATTTDVATTTASSTTTTAATPVVTAPAGEYEVLDLGDLGGDASAADVNASGLVVGTSRTGATRPELDLPTERFQEAFVWDPTTGRMTGLGALDVGCSPGSAAWCDEEGVEILPEVVDSGANALNDAGVVVGWSGTVDCTEPMMCRATRWDVTTGEIDDLGTLAGDDVDLLDVGSVAHDVNEAGLIVGRSTTGTGEHHAFVWDPATESMRDLGTLGGAYSEAHAVNDRGEVVGVAATDSGAVHLFVWTDDTGMQDLGAPEGSPSFADPTAVADDGTIVGVHGDGRLGFVRWGDPRGFEDLGNLLPFDVGSGGLVVGARIDPATSVSVPIVMAPSTGVVVELPGPDGTTGALSGSADSIGDDGTIVGSVLRGDRSLAVRWTPVAPRG